MKIIIRGEHNFFLFQDLVHYFILTLKREWQFHLMNKYRNSCNRYIYDSWYELLNEKISNSLKTKKACELIKKNRDWMVTTNVAILKAQKEIGRKNMSSFDLYYLRYYRPAFLIEHSNNYNDYIVYLDGDIKNLFLEAVSFTKIFKNLNEENFLELIQRYFIIEKEAISQEIEMVVNSFIVSDFAEKMLDSYEIVEE